MTMKFRFAAPLLAAGVVAAIATSPIAAAADDPHLTCTYQSQGNSTCETAGNAQLSASPQTIPYPTLYPFLLDGGLLFHNNPGHGMR